jgi:hypothetical protein
VIRGLHLEKPGCADVDSDSMSRNWPTCGVVIEVVPCVNRMRFALVDSFGSRFVNCSDRSVKGAHLSGNVTIPLAPLAARGNDIHGTTDFGSRGGKATARRLLAGADERARVPKR